MTDNATKTMIRAYFEAAIPKMFLSQMFSSPPENFYNTEEVELDIERGSEKVAVVVTDMRAGYHINAADEYTNKSFKPPVIKEAYVLNVYNQMKRAAGDQPFQGIEFQRAAAKESFKLFRKVEALVRRNIELQGSQIFQDGVITLYDEDGNAAYTIDFKPKATHLPTAGIAWNGVNPTIASDLNSLANVIRVDGKTDPKVTIWGEGSFNVAIEDTEFKARFQDRELKLGTISSFDLTDSGGIYRGVVQLGNYQADVWTYGGRYDHPVTGTSTPYVADARVIMLDPNGRKDATFGAIPRMLPMDPRVRPFIPGRMSSGRTGMDLFTNAWPTPDGDQLMVGAAARPLLIPTAIDTMGCIRTGI